MIDGLTKAPTERTDQPEGFVVQPGLRLSQSMIFNSRRSPRVGVPSGPSASIISSSPSIGAYSAAVGGINEPYSACWTRGAPHSLMISPYLLDR